MTSEGGKGSLVEAIRQSPPVDLGASYDPTWVKGKTFVITGGASGFGAGFLKKWAEQGANVVIGDINVKKGDELVRKIRSETGNQNLHFIHCDVTDWQSQVNFFKDAVKLSPHGGIDTVVANAGIVEPGMDFEMPIGLDSAEPPKPNLATIDVNLTGLLYTTHLALFWLPRNPNSQPVSLSSSPASTLRDRHLLLLGSVASFGPLPGLALYAASKHGVCGLFRTLRSSSFVHGVRVNMLCPYFVDTPLIPPHARLILAGAAIGKVEDVVDAGTRLAADTRISGRGLAVGPKLKVEQQEDGGWALISKGGEDVAVWEPYADDYEECEVFMRRMISMLNAATRARGWIGWVTDLVVVAGYGLKAWLRF
jgi:NAD(P)-dependent dehydrogenase (short-subunit alcohol dehydrogenase family)